MGSMIQIRLSDKMNEKIEERAKKRFVKPSGSSNISIYQILNSYGSRRPVMVVFFGERSFKHIILIIIIFFINSYKELAIHR